MTVTKRLRYEILRRDGYACRYCGAKAPEATLTVDHVTPKALGGTDDPTNLVAACRDCNTGKTSSSPDGPLVADVADDALAWAARVRRALAAMHEADQAVQAATNRFADAWGHHQMALGIGPMDPSFPESVRTFFAAGLSLPMLLAIAERTALNDRVRPGEHWRYFCGTCWGTIREAQRRAERMP